MDAYIREQHLPGVGHSYQMRLDSRRSLIIIVRTDGRREVALMSRTDDEPDARVSLTQEQAASAAVLLTGVRLSIQTEDTPVSPDEVVVETVTLSDRSPASGRLVRDIPLAGDGVVLGVIRDETPELLEDQASEPCRPGDRIVVAARRERLHGILEQLGG